MPLTQSALANHLIGKHDLFQRLQHQYLLTGIKNLDTAFGGLPRGAITEIYGRATTGKSSLLQGFLAYSTCQGEFCALVDSQDTFDPVSAAKAGADLQKLLWIRCHQPEESVQAADLLIHSGGWGIVTLDLTDVSARWLNQLPLSYWYRLRSAVEKTPTVLLVLTSEPTIRTCATMSLEMHPAPALWSGSHPDFRTLTGTQIRLTARKPIKGGSADWRLSISEK